MKTIERVFYVTGTVHGSIVTAIRESEARQLFHRKYNGESIIHMTVEIFKNGKLKMKYLQK